MEPSPAYPEPRQQYAEEQYPREPQNGPSEEETRRMQEQQFQMMKRNMQQFVRGIEQMQKSVNAMKKKLAKKGIGLPAELTNALAKAPALIAKLRAAKNSEEFEDAMGDIQDIAATIQEWGPRLGELDRLADMLTNVTRDIRNMEREYKRVRKLVVKKAELADAVAELDAAFAAMKSQIAEAKTLAKTDPEEALLAVEDFYGNTEEFWNQVSFLNMMSNLSKGLAEANRRIKSAEQIIRRLERQKVAADVIAELKTALSEIKANYGALQRLIKQKPIDFDEVRSAAEDFWQQSRDFENLLAQQGQSQYMPMVQKSAGVNIVVPQGFISAPATPAPANATMAP
jgi:hypothetical protein